MPHSRAFAPWTTTLTDLEYHTVLYSLVVAGLALLAAAVRAVLTLREVGPRYRAAAVANTCITVVATLSYAAIVLEYRLGYVYRAGSWVPNGEAAFSQVLRYMDWTVTVPMLVAELIAVTTLTGVRASRFRYVGMGAACLMILTGYLGAVAVGGGHDLTALLAWGAVSTVFYLLLYGLLIRAVLSSTGLRGDAAAALRLALVVLLTVWLIYPLASLVQIVGPATGAGTAVIQVAFCVADIVAKVGFGAVVHRVAKLRTADDVRNGVDQQPEAVWVGSVKRSDAVLPPTVADEQRVPTVFPTTTVPTSAAQDPDAVPGPETTGPTRSARSVR